MQHIKRQRLGMQRLAMTALLVLGALGPAHAAETPSAVKLASAAFTRDVTGVVAYLATADMALTAPMTQQESVARMWIANVDGRPTRMRVVSLTQGGKPASEAERVKLEKRTNASYDKGERTFNAPYDPRHAAAYRITPAGCAGCASGLTAYAFRAQVRNQLHGDGTFVVDADHHVTRVTYSPSELPTGASRAEVELGRGPVPGLGWSLVRVKATYSGGVGPLSGAFTLDQRISGHRRFATLAQAMAAAPK